MIYKFLQYQQMHASTFMYYVCTSYLGVKYI